MKKKLAQQGLDVFEPHEVLEILLYYAIPQKNTNDIAKNLIARFGSLSAVLDAPVDALLRAGLTEHQALYLSMLPGVTRRYLLDKHHNDKKVITYSNAIDYVLNKFIGFGEKEHVFLLLMDAKNKEVYSGMIAHGDFCSANISFRQIITLALNYGAVYAIIAHNHPSGNALPSKEDVIATRELKDALKMVGVTLYDHFIVADRDCVSLAESDLI